MVSTPELEHRRVRKFESPRGSSETTVDPLPVKKFWAIRVAILRAHLRVAEEEFARATGSSRKELDSVPSSEAIDIGRGPYHPELRLK